LSHCPKIVIRILFFVRIPEREEDEMEEGAEGVARAEEGAEGIGASQTLSRHHQFFPWEWVLLKSRELVRINVMMAGILEG